jgi:hypothetical protein
MAKLGAPEHQFGRRRDLEANRNELRHQEPATALRLSRIGHGIAPKPELLMSSLGTLQRYEMFGLVIEQVDEFLVALRGYPAPHHYLLEQLRSPKCVRVIVSTARRPETLQREELDAFEHVLPILYPDEKARVEILEARIRDVRREPSVRLEEIARNTEWWSGKDLDELVQSAVRKGALSQSKLLNELKVVNDRLTRDSRRNRMRELLKFTIEHCTDKATREDVKVKFSNILNEGEEPKKVPHVVVQVGSMFVQEQIMGDKIQTGDVYGGIVGAHVHHVNLTQTWNQIRSTVDLAELAGQLSSLRAELLKRAHHPEHYTEIGAISSAEIEAKTGNGSKMLEYLSKAGRWTFEVATKVGVTLAADVLKEALGIK